MLALLTNLPVPDRAHQSGLFPISLHHLPFDFFLFLSLPFFSFLKKKIRLHQGSGLVNHSIQGSFPVNQPPRFLFFHLVQWTGYQIMAANASRHKPSPLFSDIQNNDISPSHPLRSSRALRSRLNASFMGTLLSATLLHYAQKIPPSTQSLLRHKHKTRPTGKERRMAYIFLFFELIDW